ncbi:MAG: NUDIX hydrolase [Oligoflexia bacterium]|nr:NUDIX hydrolase [Oligoflexia bacterium]
MGGQLPDDQTPQRRVIYTGRLIDLGIEQARLPDGRQLTLEIIRHPGAAAIVPIHDDRTVTLVHQYRHAGGGMLYEVPAGCLEPGEPPADCARRELAEEAGLASGDLRQIATILTTPGFSDERIHIFLATGLRPTQGELDPDEYLSVVRLPLAEALAMTRDGRICDAKTICALSLAHDLLPAHLRSASAGATLDSDRHGHHP